MHERRSTIEENCEEGLFQLMSVAFMIHRVYFDNTYIGDYILMHRAAVVRIWQAIQRGRTRKVRKGGVSLSIGRHRSPFE